MDSIKQYVLTVTCCGLVCGIIKRLIGNEKSYAPIIDMMCALVMLITAISPLAKIRIESITDITQEFQSQSQYAVSAGENLASDAIRNSIIEQTRTYVLDKAQHLGADVMVEIQLDDGQIPIPSSICITGSISPYAKRMLMNDIASDLGIPEEAQIWK